MFKKVNKPVAKPAAGETTATPAGDRPGGGSGRRLLSYFLPGVVIGAVILAVVVWLAYWTMTEAEARSADSGMRVAAAALARQLAGEVEAQQRLLRVAAHEPGVITALQSKDPGLIQEATRQLSLRMKGFVQLRLLSSDWNQTDTSGPAPMGYAGVDLHRRAVDSALPQPAEVHQLKSDLPYIALAVPVRSGAKAIGSLFGALPLDAIRQIVDNHDNLPGRIAVVQGDDGNGFNLAGSQLTGTGQAQALPVGNSIWRVRSEVDVGAAGGTSKMMLIGAGALGVLGLLVIGLLQSRALSADLRRDLGSVVSLGEAIKVGRGVPVPRASVADFADTLVLLGRFAQDARHRGGPPPAAPVADKGPGIAVSEEVATTTGGHGIEVGSEAPADAAPLPPSVFRASDIRGRVGDEITAAGAQCLGLAFGTLLQKSGGDKQVLVARDGRVSSRELQEALCQGLTASGVSVVDLGAVPTPLLYFAAFRTGIDSGLVVTGSHNDANVNGFKMMLSGTPVSGETLLELRMLMEAGAFAAGSGEYSSRDLRPDYLEHVTTDVRLGRSLNVVLDGNNGIAGELAAQLLESIGCKVTRIKCDVDGSFPNGPPDPNRPEVLAALELEVEASQADLALAFDGDGDRVAVVDERGRFVPPDKVLMLMAQDILIRHPGVDVLYDIGSSRHLASFVLSNGGRPVMWKSGHAFMNTKMRETGALLGGEFSGHYYVKERWHGYDDAMYAVARLLEVMTADPRNASDLLDELPASESTPEFRLYVDEGRCEEIIATISAQADFTEAKLIDLDGLRVEYPDRWGLVRCAQSESALVFRFEAESEAALEQVKQEFRQLLAAAASDAEAPF